MQNKPLQTILLMLKYGLLFGCLMFVVLMLVGTQNWLTAPATELAALWYASGLPPRGEAAFGLSDLFVFLQFFVIGSLIGLWRCRKLQRKAAGNSDKTVEK